MREDNDIFLIALPGSFISSHEIVGLLKQITMLLKFEFGTLSNAVGDDKNKSYIDHLMSHVLGGVLGVKEQRDSPLRSNRYLPHIPVSPASHTLPFPAWLIVAEDTKLHIDSCLSEFESGDFGDSDSDCEACDDPPYDVLGSCVFYKEHVVASHLPQAQLQRVFLFAQHHGLLAVTAHESLSQMVVWRRVFLAPPEEELPRLAHYLLVVGMNHLLMAVLLESGGITDLADASAGPDPFMVDQAEASLYQLHSLHIHSICQDSLQAGLEWVTPEEKLGKTHKHKAEAAEGARVPDVPSILKQKSSPLNGKKQCYA